MALFSAIGLDWCAFQTVGWAMMFVEHSKHVPFKQALAQTFDGQHSCAICHAVQARKKAEKKDHFRTRTNIDLYYSRPSELGVDQFQLLNYESLGSSPLARAEPPLRPPPRARWV